MQQQLMESGSGTLGSGCLSPISVTTLDHFTLLWARAFSAPFAHIVQWAHAHGQRGPDLS